MFRSLAAALLCAGSCALAAAPFAGQLDFHAQRELERWQPVRTTTPGAHCLAVHDPLAQRTVGEFRVPEGEGVASLRYGLRLIRTGQHNSFSGSTTASPTLRLRARVRCDAPDGFRSAQGAFLALDRRAGEPFLALEVDAENRLVVRMGGEVIVAGPVMEAGWRDVEVGFRASSGFSSGDGELLVALDGVEVISSRSTHSVPHHAAGWSVGVGAGGGAGSGSVRVEWVLWSDDLSENLERDPWLGAVQLRDVDQTRARLFVQQDPAMLGWGQITARALWASGSPDAWPGDEQAAASEWIALDPSVGWTGTLEIEGMEAGDETAYAVEFSDGASIVRTPLWSLRAMQSQGGRSDDLELWLRYCTDHNGGSHPMVGDRVIAEAGAPHALVLQLGDFAYNETRDGPPWDATVPGILDTLRCTALSPDHNGVARRFPQFFVRSDHDGWENNARRDLYEGSMLPPVTSEFTGITTRDDLWRNGVEAWSAFAASAMLNQLRPDEDFRAFEVGDALLLFLDTRSNWNAGTILGSGPGSQLEIALELLETTQRSLVILAMDSPMGDIQTGNDNWHARPGYRAQRNAILDAIEQNDAIRSCLILAGDRHASVLHSRFTQPQGGTWAGWPKVRFEFFAGPHSNNVFQQYSPAEASLPLVHVSTTNGANHAASPPAYARMVGRVNADERKGLVRFRIYDCEPDGRSAPERVIFDRVFGLYPPDPTCPADVNADGVVTFADLQVVLTGFGDAGPMIAADRNGDGAVDFTDLNIVLAAFGAECGDLR